MTEPDSSEPDRKPHYSEQFWRSMRSTGGNVTFGIGHGVVWMYRISRWNAEQLLPEDDGDLGLGFYLLDYEGQPTEGLLDKLPRPDFVLSFGTLTSLDGFIKSLQVLREEFLPAEPVASDEA